MISSQKICFVLAYYLYRKHDVCACTCLYFDGMQCQFVHTDVFKNYLRVHYAAYLRPSSRVQRVVWTLGTGRRCQGLGKVCLHVHVLPISSLSSGGYKGARLTIFFRQISFNIIIYQVYKFRFHIQEFDLQNLRLFLSQNFKNKIVISIQKLFEKIQNY